MKNTLSCFALLLICSIAVAQPFDLNAPMPVDPAIRKGKLANGLTYYIKHNTQPEKRLELRLAVNAGSMQENPSQQGLAHFTEHMCFNGTQLFEKNELVNFLEKMGIKFGAELNAYTTFDETIYKLSVPSDRFGLIDTALLVLKEWAHNVSFDANEIDKERGVVISEWRLGLGANDRMMKKYFPVLLKDSRYAERLPIGKKEILDTFPYDTVRQFYRDWYRPDLMAVSVVGDAPVDSIEHLIKKYFAPLQNPVNERPRLVYDVPNNKAPLVCVVTDKENPVSSISIFYKKQHQPENTIGDYKPNIIHSLLNDMINSRFEEILQKPDVPFVEAGSEYSNFIGKKLDVFASGASAKENKVLESLAKLVECNKQFKQYGFTQQELDRAKKNLLRFYEKMVKEEGKTESRAFVEEYIRNFLKQEAIPGIDNEYAYVKQMLPTISVAEMNSFVSKCIADTNMAIIVMLPDNEKITVPTQQQVLDTYNKANAAQTQKYEDTFVDKPLVSATLPLAKIKKRSFDKENNITELTLANGAKVVLKPNNWKNDEVLFTATSPGGISLCKDEDVITARLSEEYINASGLGDFDNIALSKKLSGNTASLNGTISTYNEGLNGNASPKDLETLLQLTYLYFTAPRVDTMAYTTLKNQKINGLLFQKNNPKFIFSDSVTKVINQQNKRFTMITDTNEIKKVTPQKALAYHKSRFSNAADFTFILIGNFSVDSITPSLQRWIGNLPSTADSEKPKDIEPQFPKGNTDITVRKGIEPQSTVYLVSKVPFTWTREDALDIKVLCDILDIMLRESMREEQSKVYGVGVNQSIQKFPRNECTLKISFGCAPESIDTLVKTVYATIKQVIKDGPPAVDVDKEREILIRNLELTSKSNQYWKTVIERKYTGEFDLEPYQTSLNRIKAFTATDIKNAAGKYFTMHDVVKAVLVPETAK